MTDLLPYSVLRLLAENPVIKILIVNRTEFLEQAIRRPSEMLWEKLTFPEKEQKPMSPVSVRDRLVYRGNNTWTVIRKRMQCKDIPTLPILQFLRWVFEGYLEEEWRTACWYGHPSDGNSRPEHFPNSVIHAMPKWVLEVDERLVLAKMKQLVSHGLVDGCPCGCRGDFYPSEKGYAFLKANESKAHIGHGRSEIEVAWAGISAVIEGAKK